MDITGKDKARVFKALYNNAKPLGLGYIHYDPAEMTDQQAAKIIETQTDFDYYKGRVMKVDLSGNELRTDLYNRDNGENAAELAIEKEFA